LLEGGAVTTCHLAAEMHFTSEPAITDEQFEGFLDYVIDESARSTARTRTWPDRSAIATSRSS